MAAAGPQAFFLTPPPRHLAELRIDTALSAVAFSAPCGADAAGRKRRCLVPASSVRKKMLLELAPFDLAKEPGATSVTPPPPPSRTPSPSPPTSPMASRAGSTPPSPAGEFSFDAGLRLALPLAAGAADAGNIFAFVKNAAGTPGASEVTSALSFLAPRGKPADATATRGLAFLAAPERPKTPTATGPTANGGFAFAAPQEGPLTPANSITSGGLSFLASPKHPLTPMGSTATGGGFLASSEPSLVPAGGGTVVPLLPKKPAPAGSTGSGGFAFPTPTPAWAQIGSPPPPAAQEVAPLAGLATPSFVFEASRSPPPLRKSVDGSRKRPSLLLRRAASYARRKALQEWEELQQFTPPPQKIAKTDASTAGEASRSSIMSGSTASPCCTFITSPSKAAKQEAKKAYTEASQSPAGSRCSSPSRPASLETPKRLEREVEVSSSPRDGTPSPTSPPAMACSGAELVVRVTCKCGVHKEFCFHHRI